MQVDAQTGPSVGRQWRRLALVTAAVALLALGVIALRAPAFVGPYGPLVVILVGLPYGAVGLVGAVAAVGLWRGQTWGRRLALVWAAITTIGSAVSLLVSWIPMVASLGNANISFNLALLDLYLPIPFVVGAGYVLLELLGVSRTVWRVAAGLLVAAVIVIAVTALGEKTGPPIGPAPTAPASVTP